MGSAYPPPDPGPQRASWTEGPAPLTVPTITHSPGTGPSVPQVRISLVIMLNFIHNNPVLDDLSLIN